MTREELLQTAKPVFLNENAIRAILDGRKSIFRKFIDIDISNQFDIETNGKTVIAYINQETGDSYNPTEICMFQPGNILYVRETWNISNMYTDGDKNGVVFIYKSDKSEEESAVTIFVNDESYYKYEEMMCNSSEWRSPVQMPKEAARIFLKVTNVRVERLRDIKYMDCLHEGVKYKQIERDVIYAFSKVWNSTIKKSDINRYGWDANPWVWVIEFERLEK